MNPQKTLTAKANMLTASLEEAQKETFRAAYLSNKGDWKEIKKQLSGDGILPETLDKLEFTNQLSDITTGNESLIKSIQESKVANIKEFAQQYDRAKLESLIKPEELPGDIPGDTADEKLQNYVTDIEGKLYKKASSAIISRMLKNEALPVKDPGLREAMLTFFDQHPDFDIRATSVYSANGKVNNLGRESAAASTLQPPEVLKELKDLQRMASMSDSPAVLPRLMEANITSAHQVVARSRESFVKTYGEKLGGDAAAAQVYERAAEINNRNEQALMSLRSVVTDVPVAAITGRVTQQENIAMVQEAAAQTNVLLNWEALFGNADFCECDECRSVYSPSAYLVELLQYLRNNNLDKDQRKDDPKDISGTVLEKLFRRRPDLGNLQLTCENTNTVLPYVDLVNEVMESFIVHLPQYQADGTTHLDAFNIGEETSGELLSTPQHINHEAYARLKDTVYPFTLPYHQPVDTIRALLSNLDTSRHELMSTFRQARLAAPEQETLNRALDAEFLQLTEEEYIILAREGFSSGKPVAGKPIWEYYGYASEALMLAALREVKKGFLQRTGILYKELVDLLNTKYINPAYPKGEALYILQRIPSSYRYLQSLVVPNVTDPQAKYAQVITTVEAAFTDPSEKTAVREWVLKHFEPLGRMIVLETTKSIFMTDPANSPATFADDCDISKVTLQHLDGTDLTVQEYDRIQRFIRLWRKLGWTVEETDKAIIEPKDTKVPFDITPAFIHELCAIKKLLPLINLPLIQLLAFWSDIDTYGNRSLYRKLFLTHNLQALDPVFHADKFGSYLTTSIKISEHIPVLMAAMQLKEADISAIRVFTAMPDVLSLGNVSVLFRYSTLAKLLQQTIPGLIEDIKLIGDPFRNAYDTLQFIETYSSISAAKFRPAQLHYAIRDVADANGGIAPSPKQILVLAKALHDALRKIERDHADRPESGITADLLQRKLELLFDKEVVVRIMGLLDGSSQYTATAVPGLAITIPDSLIGRMTYDKAKGIVTLKGIPSPEQVTAAKALSPDKAYQAALATILSLPAKFFKDTLYAVFTDQATAKQKLLSPDSTADVARAKLVFCCQQFLPFVRKRLTFQQIVQNLSLNLKLDAATTETLVTEILLAQDGKSPLINDIEKVKEQRGGSSTEWNGYLSPAADDRYTFVIRSERPVQLWLDGEAVALTPEENDAQQYESRPLRLKGAQLYRLKITGLNEELSGLFWKTPTVPKMQVPASILFPGVASETFAKAYRRLHKTALVVNGFRLQVEELEHLHTYNPDFDKLNFNTLTLAQWKRLQAYTQLRDALPVTETTLTEFFSWAHKPDQTALAEKISELTGWPQTDVEKLIAPAHYNLAPADFVNEQPLLKLRTALKVAELIAIDTDRLFEWAKPASEFEITKQIAESIRNTMRARYTQDDWEQVVKPLNDKLRENCKQALIAYLLVQPPLQQWADEHSVALDADTLFEFFLIDVQMETSMETSRIKQAISSLQTYIQRCFLGLENDVPVDALDRERWDWMQRYRVWEANRKVFLYPENWVQPELRDNKSPFFREFESELMQKDITNDNLTAAIMSYLKKLDEVGRLDICAMYQEKLKSDSSPYRLHVFARTQTSPYIYYYRFVENATGVWSPWEKIEADIQSIEDDRDFKNQDFNNYSSSGNCLIPVVWNDRLMLFWPTFMKKPMDSNNSDTSSNFQQVSTRPMKDLNPIEYREVRLAWTEYKNGKWTPKQTSSSFLNTALLPLPHYRFVQKVSSGYIKLNIYNGIDFGNTPEAKDEHVKLGAFYFKPGNVISTVNSDSADTYYVSQHDPIVFTDKTQKDQRMFSRFMFFHYHFDDRGLLDLVDDTTGAGRVFEKSVTDFKLVRTLQDDYNKDPLAPFVYQEENGAGSHDRAFLAYEKMGSSYLRTHDFNNPYVGIFIQTLNRDGLPGMLSYLTQSIKSYEFDFNKAYQPSHLTYERYPDGSVDFGVGGDYNETQSPYAVYNWELFFHIPLLIADRLSKSQRFEEARQWFHYIFNPLSKGPEPDVKRYWQFLPFKKTGKQTLMSLFNSLKPNKSSTDIANWRDDPFNPHMVARSRPTAYMKTVVMKYLDNLIAWGDHLFRQNTMETINEAAMLYVIGAHILGPRPQAIPKRGNIRSQTYISLLDKWDAFSNAMVEMELIFPYYNEVTTGADNKPYAGRNLYGFGTSLYFGIPNNPKLMGYWDTVADRLFKIRHCMNIDGIVQKLPLFEPPIDPGLLVLAAAKGISLSSVLNDLNASMPCYRFHYLIQKAQELCGEVKAMGGMMLSVLEKKDAEALSRLRASHEVSMLNLARTVKEHQLKEANASVDSLVQNRLSVAKRLTHYLKLLDEEVVIPAIGDSFTEISEKYRELKQESDMKLLDLEKEDLDQAGEAADWQLVANLSELGAGLAHFIPSFGGQMQPFGVGVAITFGGEHVGAALSAAARGFQTISNKKSYESSNAAKKSGFFRQRQDWTLQANMAGYELMQIDKQIAATNIRIAIAAKELENHDNQVRQSEEVESFLRDKYTNQELYQWMEGQIRTVHYQAYQLSYDMAKKAEKAYRFETGETVTDFIQFGYWDGSHDGLMAGEQLALAIKQMEVAYMDTNKREYEITKHISLAQVSPLALINLKEKGICEVQLPEELFDMDFPGHYMRRLKSVAVSIPCVAGPYTSVSATLTLLQDKTRIRSVTGSQYAENTDAGDDRFVSNFVSLQSIATSNAQNDSGVFELNFRDERYLPFEGAGAVSRWRLELPATFRQFDYDTISDVVLHVRYTAREGGGVLKAAALGNLDTYLQDAEEASRGEGLARLFSLRHEFSNEWYRFLHPVKGQPQSLLLTGLEERLPFYTRSRKVKGKDVTGLKLLLRGKTIPLQLNKVALQPGAAVGEIQQLGLDSGFPAFKDEWAFTVSNNTVYTEADLQDAWLIVNYTMRF